MLSTELELAQAECRERQKAKSAPRPPTKKAHKARLAKRRRLSKAKRKPRKPRVPTNAQYLKRQARKSLRVELARVRHILKKRSSDKLLYKARLKEAKGAAKLLKANLR